LAFFVVARRFVQPIRATYVQPKRPSWSLSIPSNGDESDESLAKIDNPIRRLKREADHEGRSNGETIDGEV
jgi:hypothetical protein